jgi:leader peptidase (prepilin peptidase)/N-methyltransferase
MAFENLGLMLAAPIVGSFLGCVADRLPCGRPIISARSACDHCAHVLTAMSLVPVASWVLQRGRCRHCEHAVSIYYPIVELAAAAIVAVALLATTGPILWVSIALGWTLLTLAAMDIRHLLLSNMLLALLLMAGLASAFIWSEHDFQEHLLGAPTEWRVAAMGWAPGTSGCWRRPAHG